MSNRNQARGTAWESAIVATLNANGWPHAERRRLGGRHDRGDIAGVIGVVIEAKNAKRTELAEWVDEAEVEAANDGGSVGVVWAHRKGRGKPEDGYVVMTGAGFMRLLKEAGY